MDAWQICQTLLISYAVGGALFLIWACCDNGSPSSIDEVFGAVILTAIWPLMTAVLVKEAWLKRRDERSARRYAAATADRPGPPRPVTAESEVERTQRIRAGHSYGGRLVVDTQRQQLLIRGVCLSFSELINGSGFNKLRDTLSLLPGPLYATELTVLQRLLSFDQYLEIVRWKETCRTVPVEAPPSAAESPPQPPDRFLDV